MTYALVTCHEKDIDVMSRVNIWIGHVTYELCNMTYPYDTNAQVMSHTNF